MKLVERPICVIDLQGIGRDAQRTADITNDLMRAAQDIGFFHVKNHGIPKEEIAQMFGTMQNFFDSPQEAKNGIPVDAETYLGYEHNAEISPATGRADLKESLQMAYDQRGWGSDWPTDHVVPGMRCASLAFMAKCHALCHQILRCFAKGLGLPEDAFEPVIDSSTPDCNSALRSMHYYPVEGNTYPEGYMRLSPHTDITCITLLFHRFGETGLQVCPGREATSDFAHGDSWTPADPIEDCILINVGDVLMYMSDDLLKSNWHRIPAPNPGEYQGRRLTMAYFTNPNLNAVIQGPKCKYPPTTGAKIAHRMDLTWERSDPEAVRALPPAVAAAPPASPTVKAKA